MTTSFDDFSRRLQARLAEPLPGLSAHRSMAPSSRGAEEALSVAGKQCREAAVLIVLYPGEAGPSLILTLRRADLPDHAGQISFPGGSRDEGESLRETALREAEEEVGLSPPSVALMGTLTPLYIPPSGYCVYPFVGAVAPLPPLRPLEAEVEQILHVPLHHLLAENTRVTEEWALLGEPVTVPFYACETHKVWGATAMILAELLEALRGGIS